MNSDPNAPPPLPPRPGAGFEGQFGGANGYGMPFGGGMYNQGFPMNGYSNGMYNNSGLYGNYGGGYNNFGGYGMGMNASPESNFVRIAEEQSRGAFQSIESVVNAFASVANMLSSTHNAVFSSFRAVIGVVEQFSLLKAQLGGFFFVTLARWLRWIWRTLLVHMRLKPANYNTSEDVWGEIQTRNPTASEYLGGQMATHNQTGFNWAAAIFWIIALGGPYLIYKAVSQMVASVEEKRKWATGDREHYSAKALYDFNAASPQELSFRINDILRIAPKSEQPQVRGWLLASSDDGQRLGLVPINYIKLLSRQSASPPVVPRDPLDDGVRSPNNTQNLPQLPPPPTATTEVQGGPGPATMTTHIDAQGGPGNHRQTFGGVNFDEFFPTGNSTQSQPQ